MKPSAITGMFVVCLLLAGPALAQEFMIYPNQGQSVEQQEQDQFQCYSWAKQQSGFDPMAPPTASEAPPAKEAEQGGVVRGGLRGALVGTATGAIAGDAGKGAKIGAASGALIGGTRRNDPAVVRAKENDLDGPRTCVDARTDHDCLLRFAVSTRASSRVRRLDS